VDSTTDRILDAAEFLFAEQGYAASLREITTAAGVNLAAVNYHFGSKEELLVAVVLRRIEGANRTRLEALDRLERSGDPSIEQVIEVFLRPGLEIAADQEGGGAHFMRLIGRIHGDPDGPWQRILAAGVFDRVQARFLEALSRSVPDLSQVDLLWRLHLMVGAMVHTLVNPEALLTMSGGACDPRDPERSIAQLVSFLAGGFRAPASDRP
jgi:AcrR family transcriptional regulator